MSTTGIQTINVSAGDFEYTWASGLREKIGKDISNDAVEVSVSTSSSLPGQWVAPSLKINPTPNEVRVSVYVDATYAPGTYYLWIKVSDTPEQVVRMILKFKVV
jgi:hypothetical protein